MLFFEMSRGFPFDTSVIRLSFSNILSGRMGERWLHVCPSCWNAVTPSSIPFCCFSLSQKTFAPDRLLCRARFFEDPALYFINSNLFTFEKSTFPISSETMNRA